MLDVDAHLEHAGDVADALLFNVDDLLQHDEDVRDAILLAEDDLLEPVGNAHLFTMDKLLDTG